MTTFIKIGDIIVNKEQISSIKITDDGCKMWDIDIRLKGDTDVFYTEHFNTMGKARARLNQIITQLNTNTNTNISLK